MPLSEVLAEYEEFNNLVLSLKQRQTPVHVTSGEGAQKAHLIYTVLKELDTCGLVVTESDLEAKKLWLDLSFFAKEHSSYFPAKEYVFYNVDTVSREMTQKRLSVLSALTGKKGRKIVVASIDALLQYTADYKTYTALSMDFSLGDRVLLDELSEKLIMMGYTREDMVEGVGQFSVRGGIVDIYPPDLSEPLRIEFFDDETDSIRSFDPSTQLSTGKLKSARVTPCSEILFDRAKREKIIEKLKKQADKLKNKKDGDTSAATSRLLSDIEKFSEKYYFASMDKYVSVIYDGIPTILDYLPQDSVIFFDEPKRISERAKAFCFELDELVSDMAQKGLIAPENNTFAADYHDTVERLLSSNLVGLSTLPGGSPDYRAKAAFSILSKSLSPFQGKVEILFDELRHWQSRRATVVILAGGQSRGESLAAALNDAGIECAYIQSMGDVPKGKITVTGGSLSNGFEYPSLNFVLVSGRELFLGKRRKRKLPKPANADKITSFTDISPGDYVVHQIYGIGRYEGIHKLTAANVTRDYLKISYHGTDTLYVPVDQLNMLYKYIGSSDRPVRLNRLGGSDWNKTKAKVKASTTDLAKQLLSLYAARQQEKGYAYMPDTPWQREFEDMFPYEETPDQLRCIEEVKRDMEKDRPMDRLLCGDVGYGKTEVALRAAFKAVQNSKQVAYLVPTTILALQHYNTFTQRMASFPVKVEMLSRFRTPAEQKQTLKRLKSGETDIVIGTHRLLQNDVKFSNLGLLIIDEEHRFGVAHKEKLKQLRRDIDVLTLTATPIPRTLHMALVSIRDMSVIAEPPENRYPVQTYVMEYDETVILDAIRRELARGGQVYYLHNRVQGIYHVAQHLQSQIPEARVAVGHGKMNEEELEDVMLDMINGNINVLVCTTIIESGLDIPNVNTIIIENADKLGLAQLYQLRGRVGRGSRIAYAYLTYRRDRTLTEVAQKRLTAIREFTEFGSGFKIAMRDLEIRGAGNLLGAEQHGHMDAVGYDMYCQLLKESVQELRGVKEEKRINTVVEIDIDAHIPESYIPNQQQRIDIYKKIAAITSLADSYEVEEQIEDRFGDIPQPVRNIIDIALLKADAAAVGICEIQQKQGGIIFRFDPDSLDMRLISEIMNQKAYRGKMLFSAGGERPYLMYKNREPDRSKQTTNIKFLLQRMKELKYKQ